MRILRGFLSLAAAIAVSTAAWGVEAPKRVVTLAPSLGELAADVLGEHLERIVGVSEFTDYPPKLKGVENVGPYHRFNVEKVAALKPDLVLATTDGNPKDRVNQLQELGLKVVVVDTSDFAGVERSILEVGRALGEESTGLALQTRFKKGLAAFKARMEARSKKGVSAPALLLQLDRDPLVAAGRGTFLDSALKAVGARNALETLREGYPRPSMEELLKRDPDLILVLSMGGGNPEAFAKMVADWKRFPRLKAVRTDNVKVLNADALVRPSLRLLEGLALLEQAVWGASK